MAAQTLPNAAIETGYLLGEDGWNAPMNRNLRTIDALLQARVLDKDLTNPPTSPTPGELYIVAGPTATGVWAGHVGKMALSQSGDDGPGAWRIITPKSGWRVYVVDEAKYYRYTGSAWVDDTPATGVGEANTMSSLGGTSLVGTKSGVNLPIKGLANGGGVLLTAGTNTVSLTTIVVSATEPTSTVAGMGWVTP